MSYLTSACCSYIHARLGLQPHLAAVSQLLFDVVKLNWQVITPCCASAGHHLLLQVDSSHFVLNSVLLLLKVIKFGS